MPRMAIKVTRLPVVLLFSAAFIAVIAIGPQTASGKSSSKTPKLERKEAGSLCKKLRTAMGRRAFAASYGKKRSLSKCKGHYRRNAAKSYRFARKKCRAERKADSKAFRKKYGGKKARALRNCARRNFKRSFRLVRRNVRRAFSGCKSERKADPGEFAQKYGSKKRGVALRRCTASKLFESGGDSQPGEDPSNPGSDPGGSNPGNVSCNSGNAPGITIAVPFDNANAPYGLIPMGETAYHPKPANPRGHPGIDFQWNYKARIIASVDGVIANIREGYWPNTWDVSVLSKNCYKIGYTELESYNSALAVGQTIAAGSFIGYPQHPSGTGDSYRMIHWEFGYETGHSVEPTRLCPMAYFDAASRAHIEQIWADVNWWEYKPQFPLICSGDFNGLDR